MSEPIKGRRVVIIEGPEQGTEGKLEGCYRYFDPGSQSNRKMGTVRVHEENGSERIVRTRMSWLRETEENFIEEPKCGRSASR